MGVIRLALQRTCSAIGQQRVESIERVRRASDITVTPKLPRGQLQHLTEDLGTPQLAGECQRGQARGIRDSIASRKLWMSQCVAEHVLRQIIVLYASRFATVVQRTMLAEMSISVFYYLGTK